MSGTDNGAAKSLPVTSKDCAPRGSQKGCGPPGSGLVYHGLPKCPERKRSWCLRKLLFDRPSCGDTLEVTPWRPFGVGPAQSKSPCSFCGSRVTIDRRTRPKRHRSPQSLGAEQCLVRVHGINVGSSDQTPGLNHHRKNP